MKKYSSEYFFYGKNCAIIFSGKKLFIIALILYKKEINIWKT